MDPISQHEPPQNELIGPKTLDQQAVLSSAANEDAPDPYRVASPVAASHPTCSSTPNFTEIASVADSPEGPRPSQSHLSPRANRLQQVQHLRLQMQNGLRAARTTDQPFDDSLFDQQLANSATHLADPPSLQRSSGNSAQFSSGCSTWDKFLGGGFSRGSLTEWLKPVQGKALA